MAGTDYQIVLTEEQLVQVAAELERVKTLSLDLETSSLDPSGYIVGWSLSARHGQACYIPVGHSEGDQLSAEKVAAIFKPILESPDHIVVMHNAKFDTQFLDAVGIHVNPTRIQDTMLEVFVAAEGQQHFGLKDLVYEIFHCKMVKFEELFPRGTKVFNIGSLPISLVGSYACEDADYTLRLHNKFYDKISASFIYDLESKLWPVIQLIEKTGFAVDREYFAKASKYLMAEAEKVKHIIFDQASVAIGHRVEFKISSPKELAEVIYGMMGIPVMVKTDGGKPATSEIAFEQLQAKYPICKNILSYRSMLVNARTMADTLTECIRDDGRIHTQYNQTGATSGRFASSNPNMQNIAKLKKWVIINTDGSTYEVTTLPRDAFIAQPGFYLIEFDFKQIEFVVMAAEAGDEGILADYAAGGDVHRNTAAAVLRKPKDKVTKEERDKAKTWNYLVIYGGGGYGLAMHTGQEEEEAEQDIAQFFRSFPKLLRYSQQVREKARITKKVCTHFGRWQVVPEYSMPGRHAASKAGRAAVNRIAQGTAADIQKMGIVRTVNRIQKLYDYNLVHMVAHTHDSQTWEVHQSVAPDEIIPLLSDAMSPVIPNYPRIQVDVKLGVSWGVLKDYDSKANYQELFEQWRNDRVERLKSFTELSGSPAKPLTTVQMIMALDGPVKSKNQEMFVRLSKGLTAKELDDIASVFYAYPGNTHVKLFIGNDDMAFLGCTSLTAEVAKHILLVIDPGVEVRALLK